MTNAAPAELAGRTVPTLPDDDGAPAFVTRRDHRRHSHRWDQSFLADHISERCRATAVTGRRDGDRLRASLTDADVDANDDELGENNGSDGAVDVDAIPHTNAISNADPDENIDPEMDGTRLGVQE